MEQSDLDSHCLSMRLSNSLVSRVRFPAKAREFFQLCFTLLQLSYRKMGARPRLDICLPKKAFVIIIDDFFEEGECYGPGILTIIST